MATGNSIQKNVANALDVVRNNAWAIYGLLDAAKAPVKVAVIRETLAINDQQYRVARQLLTGELANDVYITQDGLVLTKYVLGPEQRFWHLAWSLGLLEVSGQQLVMDEDMLAQAPAAFIKLLNLGKLPKQEARLSLLQTTAKKRIRTLLKLVNMYREIEVGLKLALLPRVATKDWKEGMKTIGNHMKKLA